MREIIPTEEYLLASIEMMFVIHYLRAINNTKEKRQVCINTYIAIYFPVFRTENIH